MVEVFRIPTLAASAGVALLALVVLWLRPRDRVHRALALFLVFRALLYGLVSFEQHLGDLPGTLSVYAAIAIPFAGLSFAAVFLARHSRPGRGPTARQITAFRWALLIAAVAFEIVYFLDHELWFAPQPEAPLILFQPLTYLTYALVAATLMWAYRDPGPELQGRGLFLLGTAFAVEPAYWATFATLQLGIRASEGPILLGHDLLFAATLVVLAASLVALAWRSRGGGSRSAFARYAFFLLLPAACGVVVWTLQGSATPETFALALSSGDAFWHLALVVVAVYTLLRYRVFGLEPKVKFAVERGTMGAAFGIAVFALSETLERLVPAEGVVTGLLAAGLIALALHPFRSLGRGVADRLMPGVEDSQAYREQRKREIYRTALGDAIGPDGEIPTRGAAMLAALREDLEIEEEIHEELVEELGGVPG